MVDLKEEQRYEQLRKLAQELHIPIAEAFLTLEVFDKDGKLIQRHRQRSHSWVRNAYNHLFCQLAGKNVDDDTFGAGKLSIKDTAGSVKYTDGPVTLRHNEGLDAVPYGYMSLAAQNLNGIVVGSGTNAESFEDYVLQTKIVEGSDAGQLNHVASESPSVSYTDTTLKNELVRYFNNNSGGNVDVNEVALVMRGYCQAIASPTPIYWLQSRDKLPATVTVPDTGQLKVTYTIQLTYPA